MTYQWNRDEEDLIKRKKTFVLLLKCQQPTWHMDEPARQLNHSGMVTQGRAGIVDTALESSHLLHWNCIYSSIYIYVHKIMQTKKKKEREKYKYCIYYHTYNQSGALGMCQEGENVRGLVETPLFVHVHTGGCRIYSQSAISETPSLIYYLLYMRIL